MSFDSDLDKVIQRAIEQGWRYQTTEKGHHQFYSPDKKTIVTTSGTPGAPSQWSNFLADMKRGGYREGLATLGEFMPTIKPANGGAKLSASEYALDLFSRHPEGISSADVGAFIKSQRPDLGAGIHYTVLHKFKEKGTIERMGNGMYRLTPLEAKVPKIEKIETPQKVEEPQKVETTDPDEDMIALDEALTALSKLEGVVRRNRVVLKQLAELRKMLGIKGD